MKRIEHLTEDQALALLAALPQYRVVRGARIARDNRDRYPYHFVVEVETYTAEEIVGGPTV
jgi:hypothetical protein